MITKARMLDEIGFIVFSTALAWFVVGSVRFIIDAPFPRIAWNIAFGLTALAVAGVLTWIVRYVIDTIKEVRRLKRDYHL